MVSPSPCGDQRGRVLVTLRAAPVAAPNQTIPGAPPSPSWPRQCDRRRSRLPRCLPQPMPSLLASAAAHLVGPRQRNQHY